MVVTERILNELRELNRKYGKRRSYRQLMFEVVRRYAARDESHVKAVADLARAANARKSKVTHVA